MSIELTNIQKERFSQLMNDSKLLYPHIPENFLEVPIKFFILTGEDEECFEKLEKLRKDEEELSEINNISIN